MLLKKVYEKLPKDLTDEQKLLINRMTKYVELNSCDNCNLLEELLATNIILAFNILSMNPKFDIPDLKDIILEDKKNRNRYTIFSILSEENVEIDKIIIYDFNLKNIFNLRENINTPSSDMRDTKYSIYHDKYEIYTSNYILISRIINSVDNKVERLTEGSENMEMINLLNFFRKNSLSMFINNKQLTLKIEVFGEE